MEKNAEPSSRESPEPKPLPAPQKRTYQKRQTNQTMETGNRQLPSDPQELDRALAPHRILAAPVIGGVSKLAEVMGTSPLDVAEREGGTLSFAALLYQYGGELDARILFAMWVAGVTIPRLAEYAKKRSEAKALGAVLTQQLPIPQAPQPQGPAF
jgi:hypothetical protein